MSRDLEAVVSGGIQEGSYAALPAQSFRIGSSWKDDLLLIDDPDSKPVNVQRSPSVFGELLSFDSERTDLLVNGAPLETEGNYFRVPCKVEIGQHILEIAPAHAEIQQRKPPTRLVWVMGTASLILFAVILALGPSEPKDVPRRTVVESSLNGVELYDKALNIITGSGLSEDLDVSLDESQALQISGEIPERFDSSWEDLQVQLDENLTGAAIKKDVSLREKIENVPTVTLVAMGADPFLLLADGRKVRVGEVMTEGWRLEAIEMKHFTLTKNDNSLELRFDQ